MSPATKFWSIVVLILFLLILITAPCFAIFTYIIWNISTGIGYIMQWDDIDIEKYKKTILWKGSIFHLIELFNNYLNNKFSK